MYPYLSLLVCFQRLPSLHCRTGCCFHVQSGLSLAASPRFIEASDGSREIGASGPGQLRMAGGSRGLAAQPRTACSPGKLALGISGNLTGTWNLRTLKKGQTRQLHPGEGTFRVWAESPGLSDPSRVPRHDTAEEANPQAWSQGGCPPQQPCHRGCVGHISGPQIPREKMWLMVTVRTSQKWVLGPNGSNTCLHLPRYFTPVDLVLLSASAPAPDVRAVTSDQGFQACKPCSWLLPPAISGSTQEQG